MSNKRQYMADVTDRTPKRARFFEPQQHVQGNKRQYMADVTDRTFKRVRFLEPPPQQQHVQRNKRSYDAEDGPIKRARREALLYPVHRMRTFTSFKGTADRMLALGLYLAARHPNDCMPFKLGSVEEVGIVLDVNACRWSSNLSDAFTRLFACAREGKRFAVIPLKLLLDNVSRDGHMNILIVDTKMRTLERFEPHGSILDHIAQEAKENIAKAKNLTVVRQHWQDTLKHLEQNSAFRPQCEIDQQIQKLVDYFLHGYTYIPPLDFCPLHGFQAMQELEVLQDRAGDVAGKKTGFCVAWSYWYADLRLRYPDTRREQLIERAMLELQNNQGKRTLTEYIVSFASFFESLSPFLHNGDHMKNVIDALT